MNIQVGDVAYLKSGSVGRIRYTPWWGDELWPVLKVKIVFDDNLEFAVNFAALERIERAGCIVWDGLQVQQESLWKDE